MLKSEKIWEGFAKKDAKYYIWATDKSDDEIKFFESGAPEVDSIIRELGSFDNNSILEVGCGLGRMSVHLKKYFTSVIAVDISNTMIERAKEYHSGIENISFLKVPGNGMLPVMKDNSVSVVLSWHVLQHVPDYDIIKTYISEIYRVAMPAAKILLHFDTRPDTLASSLLSGIPPIFNPILPRNYRYGMRRYRRNLADVRNELIRIGFTILNQRNDNTDRQLFLLSK